MKHLDKYRALTALVVLGFVFLLAPALPASAEPLAAAETCVQVVPTTVMVSDSEFFEILSPTSLKLAEGVEATLGNDAEVPWLAPRAENKAGIVVAGPKSYCRCADPSGCPEDNCRWFTTSGSETAECLGGCHKSNGDACLSCQIFDTAEPAAEVISSR